MKRKGFTLIELLVVISIIALLLSILMPSLGRAKAIAQRVVCASNLSQIGKGAFMYANDQDNKLPSVDPRTYKYIWRSYTAYRLETSTMEPQVLSNGEEAIYGLGRLFDAGLIKEPKTFYCEALKKSSAPAYVHETYKADGYKWPYSPDPQGIVRTSYSFYPQSIRKKEEVESSTGLTGVFAPAFTQNATEIGSSRSIVTDLISRYDSVAHKSGGKPDGLNALFGDSHVAYSGGNDVMDLSLWAPNGLEYQNAYNPGSDPVSFRKILQRLKP